MVVSTHLKYLCVYVGFEREGVWKPIPGKALLPVLESPPATPTRLTPTPPKTHPPPDASRPSREYTCVWYSYVIIMVR